jgi:hypothetical protein
MGDGEFSFVQIFYAATKKTSNYFPLFAVDHRNWSIIPVAQWKTKVWNYEWAQIWSLALITLFHKLANADTDWLTGPTALEIGLYVPWTRTVPGTVTVPECWWGGLMTRTYTYCRTNWDCTLEGCRTCGKGKGNWDLGTVIWDWRKGT